MSNDPEFTAMNAVYQALEPLDEKARERVIEYLTKRLDVTIGKSTRQKGGLDVRAPDVGDGEDSSDLTVSDFEVFAEYYDAANPQTDSEKALVAGHWFQEQDDDDQFDSQSVNAMLKDLGHGIGNITRAVDGLKDEKPSFAIQLKKTGTSKQARKSFRITRAGKQKIAEMIDAS